jgi:pimeloyl-ACP methyl ester carboxylesterase
MLGYHACGDPQGQTILYFHGFPGSRLEVKLVEPVAGRMGIRIIGMDRPGYGLSDYQSGRQLVDWPRDVIQFADGLGIERFAVVGASGGGPYAAACAAMISHRLTGVGILCGLGPMDAPNALAGMQGMNRMGLALARRSPWLAGAIFSLSCLGFRHLPGRVVGLIASRVGEPDSTTLRQTELGPILMDSFREAVRNGPSGPLRDLLLYTRPWGFDLRAIPRKVLLWQGLQDRLVPPSMGHFLKKEIPDCEARFYPDEGHFSLIFNRREDILAALTRDILGRA